MEQPSPTRGDDASVLWTAVIALGLASLVGVAAAALLMWRRRTAPAPAIQQRARGEPARATVLRLWDTGTSQGQQPVVGFVFEVRRTRLPAYQTEVCCAVPRAVIPQVQPGATVPVRVDADNPARVALDFGDGSRSFQSNV